MIKVTVMYPYTEGARFDHAYYRDRHMPMVKAKLGCACSYGGRAVYSEEACLLTINDLLLISVGVALSASNGSYGVFWSVRIDLQPTSHLAVIIRMDASNEHVHAYYLLPASDLSRARKRAIRLSNPVFRDACRFDDLDGLCRALVPDAGASA
jgi:hypothetical protein